MALIQITYFASEDSPGPVNFDVLYSNIQFKINKYCAQCKHLKITLRPTEE